MDKKLTQTSISICYFTLHDAMQYLWLCWKHLFVIPNMTCGHISLICPAAVSVWVHSRLHAESLILKSNVTPHDLHQSEPSLSQNLYRHKLAHATQGTTRQAQVSWIKFISNLFWLEFIVWQLLLNSFFWQVLSACSVCRSWQWSYPSTLYTHTLRQIGSIRPIRGTCLKFNTCIFPLLCKAALPSQSSHKLHSYWLRRLTHCEVWMRVK